MKKLLYSLVFLLILAGSLPAQEIIVSDTNPKVSTPFEGTIRYKMTVKTKDGPDVQDFLPDTVLLTVSYPWVYLQYRGGASSTMMSHFRWNAEEGETQILFPPGELYFTTPESYLPPKVSRLLKTSQNIKILGIPCQKYQADYENNPGKDYLWVTDSISFPKSEADTALLYRPIFLHPQLSGIPLKMTRVEGKTTTILTAEEITPGKIKHDFFEVPSNWGYRIFNPRTGDRFPALKDREKR